MTQSRNITDIVGQDKHLQRVGTRLNDTGSRWTLGWTVMIISLLIKTPASSSVKNVIPSICFMCHNVNIQYDVLLFHCGESAGRNFAHLVHPPLLQVAKTASPPFARRNFSLSRLRDEPRCSVVRSQNSEADGSGGQACSVVLCSSF